MSSPIIHRLFNASHIRSLDPVIDETANKSGAEISHQKFHKAIIALTPFFLQQSLNTIRISDETRTESAAHPISHYSTLNG
jgi:hypothetical protein